MRLAIGTPAPAFRGTTWDGQPVALSDYQGKKLWLAFFRYASCPLCNVRVRAIYRKVDELSAAGVSVVAVFQSPGEKVREYVLEGDEPPMPIIADPAMKLYEQYALERSVMGFLNPRNLGGLLEARAQKVGGMSPDGPMDRIPGDFLIGPDGKLVDVFYGSAIGDHIPFERVDAFMAR
ncbi:MAG: redoxin domain-containing protein [Sandaracinaceae bacterium]|nr:redoxin domain-containing protein [Sandaracinaceae bacterium]